jgi:hypothetical protein
MSTHNPIGSCCTRPRFNAVGGIDDYALSYQWNTKSLVDSVRKVDRIAVVLVVAGIVAALAVVRAFALMLLAD